MVESLDEATGRLMEALEEAGILENTIIIFASDNGPFYNASKAHMPKEFHDVPVSSAHPMRAGKMSVYEGGTRVPLIICWPGKIEPGTKTDALQDSTDFYPTFVDMLGFKMPQESVFDGFSMRSIFEGGAPERKEIFGHLPHHSFGSTLRIGDWKLIRWYAGDPDGSDRYELFNLQQDIGERINRIDEEPALAQKLAQRMNEILKESGAVLPVKNPAYQHAVKMK